MASKSKEQLGKGKVLTEALGFITFPLPLEVQGDIPKISTLAPWLLYDELLGFFECFLFQTGFRN